MIVHVINIFGISSTAEKCKLKMSQSLEQSVILAGQVLEHHEEALEDSHENDDSTKYKQFKSMTSLTCHLLNIKLSNRFYTNFLHYNHYISEKSSENIGSRRSLSNPELNRITESNGGDGKNRILFKTLDDTLLSACSFKTINDECKSKSWNSFLNKNVVCICCDEKRSNKENDGNNLKHTSIKPAVLSNKSDNKETKLPSKVSPVKPGTNGLRLSPNTLLKNSNVSPKSPNDIPTTSNVRPKSPNKIPTRSNVVCVRQRPDRKHLNKENNAINLKHTTVKPAALSKKGDNKETKLPSKVLPVKPDTNGTRLSPNTLLKNSSQNIHRLSPKSPNTIPTSNVVYVRQRPDRKHSNNENIASHLKHTTVKPAVLSKNGDNKETKLSSKVSPGKPDTNVTKLSPNTLLKNSSQNIKRLSPKTSNETTTRSNVVCVPQRPDNSAQMTQIKEKIMKEIENVLELNLVNILLDNSAK